MNKKLCIVIFNHFAYGIFFNMFGPIIPYLTEASGKSQAEFSYVFIFRGIAYLVAGFAQKGFLSKYNPTKRIMSCCVISGICFLLFSYLYANRIISSMICLIMFLANGSIQMLINVLLTSASSEQVKKAISYSYGFYGFGGIMVSLLVSVLGIKTLMLSAILSTFIGFIYIWFLDASDKSKQQKQDLTQQIINSQQQGVKKKQQKKVTYMSSEIERFFCVLFCLYAAISLSYRCWMPSFIVMENLASKQIAAISVSIYSAFLTMFRFIIMFCNPDLIKTLNCSTLILIVTLIVSILSYYFSFDVMLIYGSSIVLGMVFSSYVPYLYALPSEFRVSFTETGTYNTIIEYAIGQAVITALIGCLMNWIQPIMLFVMILLFSILNRYYVMRTVQQLRDFNYQQKDIQIQIPNKLSKDINE